MKVTSLTPRAFEFACHSASCRPPTSGGTGGSTKGGGKAYRPGKDFVRGPQGGNYKISGKDVWRDAGAGLVRVTGKEAAGAMKAHNERIGAKADPKPVVTQGRAGSTPAQYRANQKLLIETRAKVRKRLAKKHRWDAKEQAVKDEMYPDIARLYGRGSTYDDG